MTPTSKDLQTVKTIKRLLENSNPPSEDKEDLCGAWEAMGQDYFILNTFGDDSEHDSMFLIRRQGSVLIRHGESEGNIGLPTDSPAAIRLTQKGHDQAEELAKSVASQPDLIVVSPYLRTQQTAQPLIGRSADVPVETWEVQEFSYLNPLKYAGTTETERGGFAQSYWERCDPDWTDGGGAESFRDFIRRVDDALQRLFAAPDRWTLVFTHGFFINGAILRMENPTAAVDSTLMKQFRATRTQGVLPNCKWLRIGG